MRICSHHFHVCSSLPSASQAAGMLAALATISVGSVRVVTASLRVFADAIIQQVMLYCTWDDLHASAHTGLTRSVQISTHPMLQFARPVLYRAWGYCPLLLRSIASLHSFSCCCLWMPA